MEMMMILWHLWRKSFDFCFCEKRRIFDWILHTPLEDVHTFPLRHICGLEYFCSPQDPTILTAWLILTHHLGWGGREPFWYNINRISVREEEVWLTYCFCFSVLCMVFGCFWIYQAGFLHSYDTPEVSVGTPFLASRHLKILARTFGIWIWIGWWWYWFCCHISANDMCFAMGMEDICCMHWDPNWICSNLEWIHLFWRWERECISR